MAQTSWLTVAAVRSVPHVIADVESAAMPRRQPPQPRDIQVEWNGKPYSGWYTVEGGVVVVNSLDGRKATQIGGSPVERLARTLLLELAAQSGEAK